MKVIHNDSINVELSIKDIKKILTEHFSKEFEGYEVNIVEEKTKTIISPGADPHDAFFDVVFDGLKMVLKKNGDDGNKLRDTN